VRRASDRCALQIRRIERRYACRERLVEDGSGFEIRRQSSFIRDPIRQTNLHGAKREARGYELKPGAFSHHFTVPRHLLEQACDAWRQVR
jgi:hypothetical protein